jgi:hypothetical protein
MTSLRETLVASLEPREVAPETRARRERLRDFVRAHEHHVFDVGHPLADRVRALLGWDDEALDAFVESPLVCHSSPHASMNSMPPMMAFPWILSTATRLAEQKHGAPAVHLRTQCTHHDFNDTFSKPHAWWHRDERGEVVKTHVFTRLPIKYHPILSKPAPALDDVPMLDIDRQAVELAALGSNYAYFCVIYRCYLERRLGFHTDSRVVEVPIDLLNRFTVAEVGLLDWYDVIERSGMRLRVERDNAPLAELDRGEAEAIAATGCSWPTRAVIAPNLVNFTQFYLLGLSMMVGGRAMAQYVPEMNVKIGKFVAELDGWHCEPPAFLPFTGVPLVDVLGMSDEAARCQAQYGFATSLPLVASHAEERAAAALSSLLDRDYAEFYAGQRS